MHTATRSLLTTRRERKNDDKSNNNNSSSTGERDNNNPEMMMIKTNIGRDSGGTHKSGNETNYDILKCVRFFVVVVLFVCLYGTYIQSIFCCSLYLLGKQTTNIVFHI